MTNFDVLVIGFLFGIGFTLAKKLVEVVIQKIARWYAWRQIRKLASTVPVSLNNPEETSEIMEKGK